MDEIEFTIDLFEVINYTVLVVCFTMIISQIGYHMLGMAQDLKQLDINLQNILRSPRTVDNDIPVEPTTKYKKQIYGWVIEKQLVYRHIGDIDWIYGSWHPEWKNKVYLTSRDRDEALKHLNANWDKPAYRAFPVYKIYFEKNDTRIQES